MTNRSTEGNTKPAKSAIVIVNWNGWEDTVRCIMACGHLANFAGAVFIIENGSTNDSFEKISAWLRGEIQVQSTSSNPKIAALETLSETPLRLIAAGNPEQIQTTINQTGELVSRGIYLVRSPENKGFGGGNNIGLRLALLDAQCDLFWLLNADAIPELGALEALETICRPMHKPLVCGSVLLNYDTPQTIQAAGASFSTLTLKSAHRHENAPICILDSLALTIPTNYPVGASMLINRCYIREHGLFDERIFLYHEEPDLVLRLSEPTSFICTQSRVYHKGGQSTQAGQSLADRGAKADYEFIKSRTILARKIGGLAVLMSFAATLYSVLHRVAARRFDLARGAITACLDGWRTGNATPPRTRM